MDENFRLRQLLSKLVEHKLLLIGPTVLGLVLSIIYVLFLRNENWTTRQRLMVRDDLLGQSFKPGQFSSLDSMKSRQETILEIARNPDVVRETLKQLGPNNSWFSSSADYPDNRTIEDVQGKISLIAPNGAEFGKTEVVLLTVKASGVDRSLNFMKLLLDQIEQKIATVRNNQLKSMVSEIQQARDSAKLSLQASIDQLREMEKELGPDSITMASLTNSNAGGDSALKMETVQIQSEKRAFESQLESLRTSQKTLLESKDDPMLIVTSSSSFLKEQSKLNQIAKSLVDAQKLYADAIGRYEEIHPSVQTALGQLNAMKEQVAAEIVALSSAVTTQISELEARITRLNNLIDSNNQRLIRLHERRGDHLAINSEISKRMEVLAQHEATLKSIEGLSEASGGAVWFTRIGDPQPSSAADGMAKRATVLIGGLLGFMLGLGVLILVAFPIDLSGLSKEFSQASIPHLGASQTNVRHDSRLNEPKSSARSAAATQATTRVQKMENDPGARVAIADSVTVPNLPENNESKQLDKFVSSIKSKSSPASQAPAKHPELPKQTNEKQKTAHLSSAKSGANHPQTPSAAAPLDLLTELRNSWAAQTDPLSSINTKNSQVDLSIPVENDALVSTIPSAQPVFDVTRIKSKISDMQQSNSSSEQSNSSSEDIQRIKQSLQSMPGNPFIKNSEHAKKQPAKGNLAEQIKAIGGSVIGLVDGKSK